MSLSKKQHDEELKLAERIARNNTAFMKANKKRRAVIIAKEGQAAS